MSGVLSNPYVPREEIRSPGRLGRLVTKDRRSGSVGPAARDSRGCRQSRLSTGVARWSGGRGRSAASILFIA
jgi:hypothetical protein